MKSKNTAEELLIELDKNPQRFLSKAITLVESRKPNDENETWKLLKLLPKSKKQSFRIAITGAPGVGKSTFIEALGGEISRNSKLAVLSIDPSSEAGGSILGDKTRMEKLTKNSNVFVRPSPSGSHLGGTESNTPLALKLCEAAGYEIIFVETVGVGQSEIEVRKLCDIVILLLQAKTGDDLQGIKKGIMEIADIIIINKADGALKTEAEQLKSSLLEVLHYSSAQAIPPIFPVSSLEKTGLSELVDCLGELKRDFLQKTINRAGQEKMFWRKLIERKLIKHLTLDNTNFDNLLNLVIKLEMNPKEVVDVLLSPKSD